MELLDLTIPWHLTIALGPDLALMGGAMILLLWAAWRPDSARHQRAVAIGAIVLTVLVAAFTWWYLIKGYVAKPGVIAVDNFRWMADMVILTGTAFAIALARDDNDRQGIGIAETHVLILLASSGMMLLAAARDLMIVFLAVELMSIAVYCLAGLNRRSIRAAEGALKYFLLGAFSSAFLLYGIALLYGATGSTNIGVIAGRLGVAAATESALMLAGIAFLLVGFGFKVATVPFHMWAPDVYDGAPSSITAYMAATVKAAAFVAFLRVWLEAFPNAYPYWHGALAGLAIATMVVGNVIGLAQRNLKRLLAYSSIGHAGYLLVAIAPATVRGASAMLFYLFVYTLATFGAFAVIVALTRVGRQTVMVDELSGLWATRPWLATGMAVLMLSLLGFPIFGGAGFFAKWYVLQAALQARIPQTTLAVVLVLTSVVSAGYYLYVIVVMFMRPPAAETEAAPRMPGLTQAVLAVTVIGILILGVYPNWFQDVASKGLPRRERAAMIASPAQFQADLDR
ncbi:MAG TPA: NADH-quinone oxidoreductase subunit N [Gemmatimonadaceae bacterium]|nr:NADH-quinone oxidoreductase subunit N [Gemmatimonadaceae bacterium]